jgi:large subunit ribosomal protein L22
MTKTINNYTASTILNYSPQKTRLIINEIRGLRLDRALLSLQSMQKPKAKKIYQLLRSAASNLKLVEADYFNYEVKTIVAEEAQRLYRSMPRARGSAFKIRRRYSRIKVELATTLDKTPKIEN